MPRAIIALLLTAISIYIASVNEGAPFYDLVLFLTIIFSSIIGIPILLVMKLRKWGEWWQCILAAMLIPTLIGVLGNPKIYTFVGGIIHLMALGLIVWLTGIYRNPEFTSPKQKFPISILVTPFVAIPLLIYWQALESKQIHGCIVDYEPAENPTAWDHSFVTVVTEDGETYRDGLTVGYSDPAVVGNCAWGTLTPTASLKNYTYSLHSPDSNGCNKICPNQKQ